MKTLIVYSEKMSENHKNVVGDVKKLMNKECEIVNVRDLQNSVFEDKDLVITIGGDGTFIRASGHIKETPILGINSESKLSEGALTSINEKQTDLIKDIKKNFKIKKLERIEVRKNGVTLDKTAVNDVYIGSKSQFHTSRYKIEYGDNIEEQRSSGVLISTPSGSHAWYKSAGGKPFEKNLRFLIREPYFGRLYKPEILKGEIKNNPLIVESKRHSGGIIALDSNFTYSLNYGDKIKVGISKYPLKVLTK